MAGSVELAVVSAREGPAREEVVESDEDAMPWLFVLTCLTESAVPEARAQSFSSLDWKISDMDFAVFNLLGDVSAVPRLEPGAPPAVPASEVLVATMESETKRVNGVVLTGGGASLVTAHSCFWEDEPPLSVVSCELPRASDSSSGRRMSSEWEGWRFRG